MRKDYPRRDEVIKARISLLHCMRKALKKVPSEDGFDAVYQRIKQNSDKNYLAWSLDNPRLVSYVQNPDRVHKHDWARRTRVKLGRYLRRVLNYDGTDYALDNFCRIVISQKKFDNFKLVTGEAITNTYRSCVGGSSCMTGECCEYTELYEENPDVVSMLIYEDDKMAARALVWKCDDGDTVMDRIYPNDGYHVEIMWQYAKQNGWLVRPDNSLPDYTIRFDNEIKTVTVRPASNEFWPYMDSFLSMTDDWHCGKVVLSTDIDAGSSLDSTSGGMGDRVRCCECNTSMSDDCTYHHNDESFCETCFNEHYYSCDYCGCSESFEDSLEVRSTYNTRRYCEQCVDRHAYTCADCNDHYAFADVGRHIHDEWVCNSCFDTNFTRCEVCSEHIRCGDECCEKGVDEEETTQSIQAAG